MPKKLKNKKPLHSVTQYATDIVKSKILANRWVTLACQRHLDDLKVGKKRGLYFDEAAADHIIDFFPEFLSFYEGAFDGQPFILTPHQKFIVGSLFGWKRKKDGFRRFRTAYIEEAKGNGKTPLGAGIELYGLRFDDEPGAEIYSAATTRDQAGLSFRDARLFAESSESLMEELIVEKHNIAYLTTNSFLRAVSSESRGLDGKKPHICLIDEIHEHPNDIVVRKMSAGTKTRRQSLIFEITNALAIDTPIPTPVGWTTMGDIQVNDHIFDEKGNVCNVTATTDVMLNHECYSVVFDDNSKIIADSGHLWRTSQIRGCQSWNAMIAERKSKGLPKQKRVRIGIRTTAEIKDTLKYQKYSNHNVELCASLNLPNIDLPIDPYVLGCWLGDGNSKEAALVISDNDIEMVDNIKNAGVSVGKRRQVNCSKCLGLYGIGVTGRGRQDSLHCTMKREGLLNNKHIPKQYLRSSLSQRLGLLRGLMDTDGSISPRSGRCVFTQSKHEICLDVVELVNSLGIKCTILHNVSKLNGKEFDRWDVFFYPPWDLDIFGLKRKNQYNFHRHNRKRMTGNRRIVDIQKVKSVPVKCISVDSDSHLFLISRSMIPTHNSGYDRHSICFQHHEYTGKILEGLIQDDTWFGLMTGLDVCPKCVAEGKTIPQDGCPDCDDWRDERCWPKANPNIDYLGAPFRDYLKKQVAEAKAMPSQENIVKRLNFNIWTESITKWLPIDKWNSCAFPVDPEALKGRTCYGGLDLSSHIDLTAWVLVFPPEEEGGLYEILCRFFLPEDNMMERVRRDKVPYDVWARQGYIKLTPGNIIDYAFIVAQIEQDMTDYQIAELAFDRWGSQKITTDLQDLGFEIEGKRSLIQFGQGFASMSAPTKEVEKMVLSGELAHGGNPVLSWNVSNVAIRVDPAENKKPDKEKSIERIDGAVALVMAVGRAMLRGGLVKSVYDDLSPEQIVERLSL